MSPISHFGGTRGEVRVNISAKTAQLQAMPVDHNGRPVVEDQAAPVDVDQVQEVEEDTRPPAPRPDPSQGARGAVEAQPSTVGESIARKAHQSTAPGPFYPGR